MIPAAKQKEAEAPVFTIVTGLSGAGRSVAAKSLEDLGYFVIDNLPPALIEKMAELVAVPSSKVKQIALVVDVRGGEFFPELEKALAGLKERGIDYRILFLEASDPVLVRRFEGTRRRHPLAPGDRVIDGIFRERRIMRTLRDQADMVVDTSDLNEHELRDRLRGFFAESAPAAGTTVNLISFGYKYGLPLDADLVFDCRFLPNPHWVEELRPLDGTQDPVRAYVLQAKGAEEFLEKLKDLLAFLLPGFIEEGKQYLTVAIGCTGGKHRSVVIAEELAKFMEDRKLHASVIHRDIERE